MASSQTTLCYKRASKNVNFNKAKKKKKRMQVSTHFISPIMLLFWRIIELFGGWNVTKWFKSIDSLLKTKSETAVWSGRLSAAAALLPVAQTTAATLLLLDLCFFLANKNKLECFFCENSSHLCYLLSTIIQSGFMFEMRHSCEPSHQSLPLMSSGGQSTGNSACSGLPFTVK